MNRRLQKNKHTLKVGLTGGIGAGKSIVAKVFSTIGIPVFDADSIGKRILSEDAKSKDEIIELLGTGAYIDGEPNRAFIAQKIFNDSSMRDSLNAIIHPKVAAAYEKWVLLNEDSPYTIKESAISFETGIYKRMDAIVLVVAPEKLRMKRVKQRDNVDEDAVKKRMGAQWSDKLKIPLADFIVTNDEQCAVLPQVLEIHKNILRQSEPNK